jgi:ketosteroid isomerase-like protein
MTPSEHLMKTVLEAWGQADLGPAYEAFDENIVWKSASTNEDGVFRFGGIYKGRTQVIALLSQLSTRYYFQRCVTKEIISNGEIHWGLFEAHGTYIPPGDSASAGKPINVETAFRWRIRNGKILEVQSFFDTAALLAQQGQLHISPSDKLCDPVQNSSGPIRLVPSLTPL